MPGIGLQFSAAQPRSWWPAGATMALDFVNDRYMKDGAPVARSAVMSFARTTAKLADDSTGTWRTFAADMPAITDRGLLLEPADTNYVPNAGRPELMSSSAPSGITRQTLSTQIVQGLPTVTLRFFGTASASGEIAINPIEFNAGPAAAQGQTWHAGIFAQLVAGTLPTQSRLGIFERDAGFALLDVTYVDLNLGPTIVHRGVSRTFASPAAARATSSLRMVIANGQSYDFNLAVGPAGLSQAAWASPILTMGVAATRAADAVEVLLPATLQAITTTESNGATSGASAAGSWSVPASTRRTIHQIWSMPG